MNPRHLEFLRMIIERGSFAKAAQAIGVSQPAVTLAMQTLEQELGFSLFRKQGRQKYPTDRALAFAKASHEVSNAMKRLSRVCATAPHNSPEQPTLRVGAAPAAGLIYGPLIYNTLREKAPKHVLQILTGSAPELLEKLQQQLLDFVIAPIPRKFPLGQLRRHVMYVGDPIIYARVGHPLAKASTLSQIARADWVVTGVAGTPGNLIEEAFRVRRWTPPRIAVQCANYTMLLRLVADTDLLGVVSNSALVRDFGHLGIQPLAIREGLPRYDVCLVWSEQAKASGGDSFTSIIEMLVEQGLPSLRKSISFSY
jgi:LysR family transcriptional regulator, regulator of abg operon